MSDTLSDALTELREFLGKFNSGDTFEQSLKNQKEALQNIHKKMKEADKKNDAALKSILDALKKLNENSTTFTDKSKMFERMRRLYESYKKYLNVDTEDDEVLHKFERVLTNLMVSLAVTADGIASQAYICYRSYIQRLTGLLKDLNDSLNSGEFDKKKFAETAEEAAACVSGIGQYLEQLVRNETYPDIANAVSDLKGVYDHDSAKLEEIGKLAESYEPNSKTNSKTDAQKEPTIFKIVEKLLETEQVTRKSQDEPLVTLFKTIKDRLPDQQKKELEKRITRIQTRYYNEMAKARDELQQKYKNLTNANKSNSAK